MVRLMACLFFFSTALFARQEENDTLLVEEPSSFSQSDIGIIAAVGLSTGGGFGDLVNAELRDQGYVTTGRMIFFNADLGMEFRAWEHLFLSPRISWMHTTLNRRPEYKFQWEYFDMDDVTIFSMLTCSAGGRYYFYERLPFLFYVEGDVGYMIAASRVSKLIFSPDGPSASVLAGYSFSWGRKAIGLELGYRSIPVSHPRSSLRRINGHTTIVTDNDRKDFGGMFLNLVWRLDFF